MIDFIVDEIYPSYDDGVRNHENYVEFICKTPGCTIPIDPNHWGPANKITIKQLIYSNHVQLITKEQHTTDNPSFYIINMKNNTDFINQDFWNNISEDTLIFLKNTNIPILLFYPLESITDLLKDKQHLINLIQKRNFYNLKNKLIILTLSKFVDLHNNHVSLTDLCSELEGLYIVPSIAFLIRYGSKMTRQGRTTTSMFTQHNRIVRQNYNLNAKKYNFVCLNNLHRMNRAILLQALFLNKNLWNHNIITCRHDPIISVNFLKREILATLTQEKNYYNKNLEIFDNSIMVESQVIELHSVSSENQELMQFLNSMIQSLENGNVYPKVIVDDHTDLNDNYDLRFFMDTFFSLITETYNTIPGVPIEVPMITEKTVKSLMNHHAFIVFGHAYCHQYLQKLGFRTFEYIINLPKDGQKGNITLFERLFNLINALNSFDFRNVSQHECLRIQEDVEYNYQHLLNTDWCKIQCDLLKSVI